ncbi:SCO4225 family membrane protein, partial [Streptomyces mirabilis]
MNSWASCSVAAGARAHRKRERLTDNWLSRVYLAAVTAATGYVLFDALFVDHPDA